jgi:hypothetical protein
MRFIFHIGAGKTGSSSIQATLSQHQDQLKAQGIKYLGLMLEHSSFKNYPWQQASHSQMFHALSAPEASSQAFHVIHQELNSAASDGIDTFIWSNESFFDQHNSIIPVAQKLVEIGIDVTIVAYVRQYSSWIQSAYLQWGIKHKTYQGGILPFKAWSQQKANISFAPQLQTYNHYFKDRLLIRNMQHHPDSVEDFLSIIQTKEPLKILRTNEALSNEETLLRALFNDHFHEPLLPHVFEKTLFNSHKIPKLPPDHLATLFPNSDALEEINERVKEDRSLLNEMLKEKGEPPLKEDGIKLKSNQIDSDKLLMLLAQIVVEQSLKIKRLQREMRELKK